MLAELILIAAAAEIYNPMDMSGHRMYPSGVKEADKYPRFAPPQSKLAKLTLPRNIYDKNGTLIKSGHYLAALSISQNEILIFEGTREIFALPITSSVVLEKELKLSTAEFLVDNNGESYISLVKGKYKVFAKVSLADLN